MMSISTKLTTFVAGLALSALMATNSVAQETKRSITKIAGDVYYFQNNFHLSLVTVTGAGVVVIDPINAEASEWLKDNLSTVTDQPITHLIYSHSHDDHASGGEVYVEAGAKVVAQANAPESIYGVTPDQRFDDTMNLEVGGKTFELTYLGVGHGEDLIAVVVRPENIAFITDAVSVGSTPFLSGSVDHLDGWVDQIKVIETLDFEILAPAHGRLGVKKDATNVRVYIETLRAQVLAGLSNGNSVDELATSITMEGYGDWAQFGNWHEANIRGMATFLEQSGQVN